MIFQLKVRVCCESVEGWLAKFGPNCSSPETEATCLKLKLTVQPADPPRIAPFPAFANNAPIGAGQPGLVGFPGFAPVAQPPNQPALG